jgi:hypothetical protein
MNFLQAIKSDISVRIVCNKTGGTINRDIKKISFISMMQGQTNIEFPYFGHPAV